MGSDQETSKRKEVDYSDPVEAGKMRQIMKAAKKEFPEYWPKNDSIEQDFCV